MSFYDPDRHHRQSIRLDAHDYSHGGVYFVTQCVHGRLCLFGDIREEIMRLNTVGLMVEDEWCKLPDRFPSIHLDAYVVMPNHLHGILIVKQQMQQGSEKKQASLGMIIGAFKSLSTNRYIKEMEQQGWPPFERKIWQRNYYERVIRNDRELSHVRHYIVANPASWTSDPDNPSFQQN